ncbi:MAG: hypothetical protein U0795_07095 [Pirellulales bacterium]
MLFPRRALGVLFAASVTWANVPDCSGRIWDAGGDGVSWEDRCNWSGNEGFPGCTGQQPFAGDDAEIPFGHVLRSAVLFDVTTLTVGPSAVLDISGALGVSSGVANDGDIALTGVLGIGESNPNITLLQGSGEVILQNSNVLGPARLNGASYVASYVTQGAGHTIRGEGYMDGKWLNEGLIRGEETTGDQSGVLTIGGTMANQGVIRSSPTGTIRLETATLNMGATGQFIADVQPIQLSASTINGGSIDAVNGGKFVHSGFGTVVLSGVTVNGDLDVLVNNAGVHVTEAGITNNGTMTFDNIGLQSQLSLANGATLGGTGTVILNSESDLVNGVRILGGLFTQGTNHTIRGVGAIRASVVNNGTILAEPRNGTLLRLAPMGPSYNNSLIQANAGAKLRLESDASVTQSGTGRIRAAAGGTVELPNANIVGGRLETEGSGLVVATNATLTDVTNAGNIQVPGGFSILRLAGSSFTNQGEVQMNPAGTTGGTLRFQNDMILNGTGVILNSGLGARMETWEANKVVTQAAGHTIRGNGQITWGTYINHGRLEGLSAAEPLVINADISGDGTLKDVYMGGRHTLGDAGNSAIVPVEGSYELGGGGRLLVDIGGTTPGTGYDQLNGTGPITISNANTRLEVTILPGFIPEPGSTFTVVTTTNVVNGTFGTPVLPANIANRSLTWKPVSYTGNDVVLELLSVNPAALPGDFDLDGKLTATDIDLLSAEIRNGGHNALFNVNEDAKIDVQDRNVWVSDQRRTMFGDANLDGTVNFPDLMAVAHGFGHNGGWAQGDSDGSGKVDATDYAQWAEHVGFTQQAVAGQPAAKLVVVPKSGEVFIDARAVEGGLRAFLLRPESAGPQFLSGNFVSPFANSASAALASPNLLVDFTSTTGSNWLSLGAVLPSLDASVNADDLWSVASYASMTSDDERALQPVFVTLGDYDADTDVDSSDLLQVLSSWTGALDEPSATADYTNGDFDFDFDVDSADLLEFLENWTGALGGRAVLAVPEPQFAILPLLITLTPLFAWLRVSPRGRRAAKQSTSESSPARNIASE